MFIRGITLCAIKSFPTNNLYMYNLVQILYFYKIKFQNFLQFFIFLGVQCVQLKVPLLNKL